MPSDENYGDNPRERKYYVGSRRSLQNDPGVVVSNSRAV